MLNKTDNYLKIKNKILSSKINNQDYNNLTEIKSIKIESGIKQLPEIGFWYLFLISRNHPSVQKRKMAKKLKNFAKNYFIQTTLKDQDHILDFLWKIRDVFIPVKEETDLLKSKPNNTQLTYIKLRNCTTSDETNQLLLKTNVYIDNINLILNISQKKSEIDFEYLFQLYSFPIDKFFVKTNRRT